MTLEMLQSTTDVHSSLKYRASHLTVKYDNQRIDFPYFCASKVDYDKSSEWNADHDDKLNIHSEILQYHVDIQKSKIMTYKCKEKIKDHYDRIVDEHSPIIKDFDFVKCNQVWTTDERTTALNLQKDLNTSFLSDVVVDRTNINIEIFEAQLDDLDAVDKNSIKCPTISLYTPLKMFQKQLDIIIGRKYKRFNIEWGGITRTHAKWLALSMIDNKKIWCNLVNIFQKMQQSSRRSNPMIGFIHGFHTCGLSFKNPRRPEHNKPWELLDSYRYNRADEPEGGFNVDDYKKYDTLSHNFLQEKMLESYIHIDNGTFFSEFLPAEFE